MGHLIINSHKHTEHTAWANQRQALRVRIGPVSPPPPPNALVKPSRDFIFKNMKIMHKNRTILTQPILYRVCE